jgi:hypothetical protein
MPPPRAELRATKRAPRSPRVYARAIGRLTRIAVDEGYGDAKTRRTLFFQLHTRYGLNGPGDRVDPENVPAFEGDTAWFEMEKVERGDGHRWPWWRAVRQVEPPPGA